MIITPKALGEQEADKYMARSANILSCCAFRKVTGALKAVHDKYVKALGEREEYQAEFQEAMLYNDQIGGLLNKVPSVPTPVTEGQPLQFTGQP